MVKGLDRFKDHFQAFADRYVLIGGTACDLILSNAGMTFRATKDLDIVLCVESLDAAFGAAFWQFVTQGQYELQEASTVQRKFYRFKRPKVDGYPSMLELFARVPDAMVIKPGSELTPIPIDDAVSSLSAILLDADYYSWIQTGKHQLGGLPVLRAEYLIALKAKAWLDLRRRAAEGQRIDSNDIKKHRNDVFRLYAVVDPEFSTLPGAKIRSDLREFLSEVASDPPDLKSLGLPNATLRGVSELFGRVFQLNNGER